MPAQCTRTALLAREGLLVNTWLLQRKTLLLLPSLRLSRRNPKSPRYAGDRRKKQIVTIRLTLSTALLRLQGGKVRTR